MGLAPLVPKTHGGHLPEETIYQRVEARGWRPEGGGQRGEAIDQRVEAIDQRVEVTPALQGGFGSDLG